MVNYVGQQLGNYRVTRLLAEGGFAQVYLGEHLHLGTVAAIKVLLGLSDQEKLKFRDEARTVARLIHPNIIRLLDFGIEGNTPFMVMDYAPGGTLKDRHPTGTALPLPTILSYVNQIADALQYAHSEKIIHRDIKPENILIGRRNEILLGDFGIAVIAHSTRSQKAEEVIGTWIYTAPEQFKGKPQPASDQYALAVIVYRWLCGFLPFQGSFAELYNQHLSVPPPSLRVKNPAIPSGVEQVVLRALAKDPNQRFASIQEFASALEQANELQKPPVFSTLHTSPSQQSSLEAYCTKCKKKTEMEDAQETTMKNGSPAIRGICAICGTGMFRIGKLLPQETQCVNCGRPLQLTQSFCPNCGAATTLTIRTNQHEPVELSQATIYTGHDGAVYTVGWSPDGQIVASGSEDYSIHLIDLHSGTRIRRIDMDNRVYCLYWSPDGKEIAAAMMLHYIQRLTPSGTKTSICYNENRSMSQNAERFSSVAWLPDGTHLVYAGEGGFFIRRLTDNKPVGGSWGTFTSVTVSPDSMKTAAIQDNYIMQVFATQTGKQIKYHSVNTKVLVAISWSPDGKKIASARTDGAVNIINSITGASLLTFTNHKGEVSAVDCSPFGDLIASGGVDNSVQVFDALTGSSIVVYKGHTAPVKTVKWSPDGTHIASGGLDGEVHIWQVPTIR